MGSITVNKAQKIAYIGKTTHKKQVKQKILNKNRTLFRNYNIHKDFQQIQNCQKVILTSENKLHEFKKALQAANIYNPENNKNQKHTEIIHTLHHNQIIIINLEQSTYKKSNIQNLLVN